MTGMRDPDEIIGAFLDRSPGDLPDTTRRAIATSIRTIRQRRRSLDPPWRPHHMVNSKIALIAAVLVLAAGAVFILNRDGSTNLGVGAPSANPNAPATTPAASAPATPVDTIGWQTFTSARHGYSVSHPADWTAVAATQPWNLAVDQNLVIYEKSTDRVTAPISVREFAGYGGPLPAGVTYDEFVTLYQAPGIKEMGQSCFPPQADWRPITIDGQSAGLYTACGYIEAQLAYGGRVWIFSGYGNFYVDAPQFEAMLATIRLQPENADDTPVAGMPTWSPPPGP